MTLIKSVLSPVEDSASLIVAAVSNGTPGAKPEMVAAVSIREVASATIASSTLRSQVLKTAFDIRLLAFK